MSRRKSYHSEPNREDQSGRRKTFDNDILSSLQRQKSKHKLQTLPSREQSPKLTGRRKSRTKSSSRIIVVDEPISVDIVVVDRKTGMSTSNISLANLNSGDEKLKDLFNKEEGHIVKEMRSARLHYSGRR